MEDTKRQGIKDGKYKKARHNRLTTIRVLARSKNSRPVGFLLYLIGNGDPIIAKRCDSLNSQLLVYNGDRQAPPGSSESIQKFNRWQIQADG
jgi:hypothetical protein